jgi:hypothetical protein
MQQTLPPFSVLLGPLLGFLFTLGTLLFVALNAHRTLPVAGAEAAAPTDAVPSGTLPESAPPTLEQVHASEPTETKPENS